MQCEGTIQRKRQKNVADMKTMINVDLKCYTVTGWETRRLTIVGPNKTVVIKHGKKRQASVQISITDVVQHFWERHERIRITLIKKLKS